MQQLNKQLWNATDKLVRTKDLFAEKKERMTANTLALRQESVPYLARMRYTLVTD